MTSNFERAPNCWRLVFIFITRSLDSNAPNPSLLLLRMSTNGPVGTRNRHPSSSSQHPGVTEHVSSLPGSSSATTYGNIDLESQGRNSAPHTPTRFTSHHAENRYAQNVKRMDNEFESPSSPQKSSGSEKQLVVFGFDISHLSAALQFIVLMSGLLIFMCLYGYFQELVIYGWFNRQLSIFSTFMHFFGCSVFALVQRRYFVNAHEPSGESSSNYSSVPGNPTATTSSTTTGVPKTWLQKLTSVSMGNAPPRVAAGYYLLQIALKTLTQGFANLCMTQINYPAKVLFKSANPVVTMVIGLLWFRKSYALRDYVVVFLLVLGLYIFITTDKNSAPQSTWLGILYVSLSMFFGASVPMIQEHCMTRYNASVEELLYYSFIGSTVFSFIFAGVAGELVPGFTFLYETGTLHLALIFTVFTSVGFYGANFSTLLTQRFGSLVNGIANTVRKAITLGLSFALFPERNVLTIHHIVGATVFMTGLLLRILFKENSQVFQHMGMSLSQFLLHRFGITLNVMQYLSPYAGKPLLVHDHVSDDGLSDHENIHARNDDLNVSKRSSPHRVLAAHNGSYSDPSAMSGAPAGSAPAYISSSSQPHAWSKFVAPHSVGQSGSALVEAELLPLHRRQQMGTVTSAI